MVLLMARWLNLATSQRYGLQRETAAGQIYVTLAFINHVINGGMQNVARRVIFVPFAILVQIVVVILGMKSWLLC